MNRGSLLGLQSPDVCLDDKVVKISQQATDHESLDHILRNVTDSTIPEPDRWPVRLSHNILRC